MDYTGVDKYSKPKWSLEINSRFELAEERSSNPEDRLIQIMWPEGQKDKRIKKTEQSLRKMSDTIKCTNIHVTGVPAGGNKKIRKKWLKASQIWKKKKTIISYISDEMSSENHTRHSQNGERQRQKEDLECCKEEND